MNDELMLETYELTFRHFINVGGKRVAIEEPKTCQINVCDGSEYEVSSYKNHIIDELFLKMKCEVFNDKEAEKRTD